MKEKLPVILDVDTGIDDAAAIIMATYQDIFDVQLITCCFGNVPENQVVTNTLTVLEIINKENIPVAKGLSSNIDDKKQTIRAHGINGLGGYSKEIHTEPLKISCSKAMHEVIGKNELTYIIACGPYTNIAKYIKEYPEDMNKFKLIAVTGSNETDDNDPYLNFNINVDLNSFKYVLKHVPNIIFCTSDMGHSAYIRSEHFIKSAKCSEAGRFLATVYPSHKDRSVKDGAALHDACGVAWLSKPKMFTISYANAYIKTAKNGKEYLKFDYNSSSPNCVVTTAIKKHKFYSWYYKTLKKIK